MDIETKRIIFLSKNKRAALKALTSGPKMIYEIRSETKILLPNLSRTLKELGVAKIIRQKNPEVRKGKIFELTEKGREVLKEFSG